MCSYWTLWPAILQHYNSKHVIQRKILLVESVSFFSPGQYSNKHVIATSNSYSDKTEILRWLWRASETKRTDIRASTLIQVCRVIQNLDP